MVELVVGGGDVVEHLFYLLALFPFLAVGHDFFLRVVHDIVVYLCAKLKKK